MTVADPLIPRIWRAAAGIWRGVSLLVLLGLATTLPLFWRWSSRHNAELQQGSRVVSTAKGEIEVAVVGDGVPFLHSHGSPGGYDQSLVRYKVRPTTRGKTIAVSRPGYLRTPLTSGRTPQEQADLYAALLDVLHVPRVIVQGSSAGGYSALQFALRHPDRAIALILYAPDLGSHEKGRTFAGNVMDDYGRWLVTSPLLFRFTGPQMARGLDVSNDDQREVLRMLIRSTIPASLHSAGRRNDLEQRTNPDIDRWPVEQVRVPTLIVHGTKDENASYERSVELSKRIPGARLVSIEGGDHLVSFTRPDEVSRPIDAFINALPDQAR